MLVSRRGLLYEIIWEAGEPLGPLDHRTTGGGNIPKEKLNVFHGGNISNTHGPSFVDVLHEGWKMFRPARLRDHYIILYYIYIYMYICGCKFTHVDLESCFIPQKKRTEQKKWRTAVFFSQIWSLFGSCRIIWDAEPPKVELFVKISIQKLSKHLKMTVGRRLPVGLGGMVYFGAQFAISALKNCWNPESEIPCFHTLEMHFRFPS